MATGLSPVPATLTHFITHVGGSSYFNINSSYYDYDKEREKDPVVNRVNYKGSITDNYSFGTALTDNDVGFIVDNAILSGRLPVDLKGQYFVLLRVYLRRCHRDLWLLRDLLRFSWVYRAAN